MAAKQKHSYFLNPKEFGKKVHDKYIEVIVADQREKIELDMVNFTVFISLKQEKEIKINLCHLYKKCFVDLHGKISAEEVEALVDEFVTNSLHDELFLKGGHVSSFEKIKNNIFPMVRQKTLVDDYNKISCAKTPDSTITFFSFRSLPGIGVSLAKIEGPLISSIHRGTIKNWCREQKAKTTFAAYKDREEQQLNLILDLGDKDFLQEEIALLQIAKENFTKLIKKKFKKGDSMWYRYPTNAFKAELDGQEFSNLAGSLLLLPELIVESRLQVKGDTIAVAAEESTLFIGGAQDPLALCFIGDLAIELKDERYFVTVDALRLVKHGKGLWKWVHYVPKLEKKEFSVPKSTFQVDMIFKSITTKSDQSICRPFIPVFSNLPSPLSVESQLLLEQYLEDEKFGKPHCVHIPLCWYCGSSDRKLKQCEGCLLARYCEKKCQKAHWKLHKEFCKCRSAVTRELSRIGL